MKKKLTLILFLSLFVACGKNQETVQLTKRSEKIEKIERVLSGDKKTKIEIEKIKAKYKNNSRELDKRLQEYSKESMKNLSGCLGMFIQLPIIYALFNVFSNLNISSGSILIPWVSSLGLHDNYFIVPIIYVLTMLAPNLISYIPYFNVKGKAALNKANMISTIFIGLMFTMKAPVALGLYFISSSLFSLIEENGEVRDLPIKQSNIIFKANNLR